MHPNYTLSDLVAVSAALLTYTAFAVPPGYLCGWGLNAFQFRSRSLRERLLISVPLSFSVFPVTLYLLGRFVSMAAVWSIVAVCCIGFVVLLYFRSHRATTEEYVRPPNVLFGAMMVWALIAIGVLVDFQIGNRLYSPTVIYDYNIRTAFVAALSRSGIPAINPFFYPGHLVLLRYHYFGLIAASLVAHLWDPIVSSRQALIATTVWTGFALIALVAIYARLSGPPTQRPWRRSILCIALLAVTGLDVIPIVLFSLIRHSFLGSLEWWNEPIMAWVHALLWVPHHVHGLIACMTGFLLVGQVRQLAGPVRTACAIAAGVCWATAVGTSIHVTLVFAAAMAVWTFVTWRRKQLVELKYLVFAGVVAAVLSLPFLIDMHSAGTVKGHGGIGSPGGPFVEFKVRGFTVVDSLLYDASLNQRWLRSLVDACVLPLNYFMELGFFFLAAAWWLRRRRREQQPLNTEQFSGIVLFATTAVVCSFFRSGTINNNDLGWRGWLIGQFILLLWAADLIETYIGRETEPTVTKIRRIARIPNGVGIVLLIGVLGSIYETGLTRLFVPFMETGYTQRLYWLTPDDRIGERTFALRGMYRSVRHMLPQSAVIQNNPRTAVGDLFAGEYADRQSAAGLVGCGTVFGGSIGDCLGMIGPLARLYSEPSDFTGNEVEGMCRKFGINVLVVKDTDPAWYAPHGWPSQLQPLFTSSSSKAYLCSPTTLAASRNGIRPNPSQAASLPASSAK